MSRVEALRRPLQEDLSGFVSLLRRLQVPHRVSEERDAQVLWVPVEPLVAQVRELYLRYPRGAAEEDVPTPAHPLRPGLVAQLRASWMTSAVLLLTLLVATVTLLGDNFTTLRWLTFQDFHIQGDYIYFQPWLTSLEAGQWWRLVSPMFIHFGVLHLAMNAMWYWELGRRIEFRQGAFALLGLSLLFGLLSNLAQFWFGGPSLFGGLSGVLYGLLGYCWIFQLLAPTPAYALPRGVLAMMLIWLLVCLSGVIDTLGFGSIANAAHVGGLAAGCAAGLIGGALARARR
ncbi:MULTISPECIES: rhomboid family intramembrane serine protease [unclassified Pseudomonas]|uniref:rhomboid family intramembrane serine protease n=1 Tax=unclassified Pseudomonas TaxID=196821 RepID=UPI00244CBE8B|nr:MULTISPECIES: rhomboid family intramembrane serine protease [unclassified Pseudomonas]MDG9926261.1 rhomboid family intramembrane serine protease [Pseudomonas sp. GD04045]MDH0036479.1 rhomboid family intramembrane serine protease [Pseudomonas sp. GD04019]